MTLAFFTDLGGQRQVPAANAAIRYFSLIRSIRTRLPLAIARALSTEVGNHCPKWAAQ